MSSTQPHSEKSAASDSRSRTASTPSPTQPRVPDAAPAAPEPSKTPTANSPATDSREQFPFVAVTIGTTGIHPSTARMVSIDALTFDDNGVVGQDFHAVLNPEVDPGPVHLHGLTPQEIAAGQRFDRVLKALDRLLDGRQLIVHDTSFTWGFIVSEARRAMTAAARLNRARSRGKNRTRRRRHKVGHIPAPASIVDTLASARRQSVALTDIRLSAVALRYEVETASPRASVERAALPEATTSRAQTELLVRLYRAQAHAGELSSQDPDQLRGDRFGLQRSHIRVDAAQAPRLHTNPGKYTPGGQLQRGMEVVIAPEIALDPDEVIAACVREELNYSEKLTRDTSVVVCNATGDFVGKPMHAQRKGIPLLDDASFIAALDNIAAPASIPAPADATSSSTPRPHQPVSTAHVPNSNNRRSGAGAVSSSSASAPGAGSRDSQRPTRRRRRRGHRPAGQPGAQAHTNHPAKPDKPHKAAPPRNAAPENPNKQHPGRPNSGRPNPGRPSSGRPDSGRPNANKPNPGRPNSNTSDQQRKDHGERKDDQRSRRRGRRRRRGGGNGSGRPAPTD